MGAFCGCTNLREVVLNEGYEAFTACESLNVILSVTEVGSYTFAGCINLKEVTLNEGLKIIIDEVFDRCPSLECVKFPAVSKSIYNLIEVDQTEIEDKITIYQHFEWRGGELLVSSEAIMNDNCVATTANLDQVTSFMDIPL